MKITILGVNIDNITLDQTINQIEQWLKGGKHYIVTTNIEFIMAAQSDNGFKKILNDADLSIPDSTRLGWAYRILQQRSFINKLLLWPFFIFPKILEIFPKKPTVKPFPVVTGSDLVPKLCEKASKKGFTVAFLGGREGIAEKAGECLKKEHPKLKIVFSESGGIVDRDGNIIEDDLRLKINDLKVDILFVAFGHGKQEKWIYKNMDRVNAKVFMGIGGTLDYISGQVPRAPEFLRNLGFEWLFRLIIQPWRIKRFLSLIKFTFLVLWSKGTL